MRSHPGIGLLATCVRPARGFRVLTALLILGSSGCSDDATGPVGDALGPISGTITLSADNSSDPVLMGSFESFSVVASDDVVTSMDGEPPHTAEFALTVSSTGTSRSYTYELPSDPEQFGLLVAWIDLDGDGLFDEGTEPARLPVKEIEGTPEAIVFWGSFSVNGNAGYLISPGGGQNFGLDVVGASGFDFSF